MNIKIIGTGHILEESVAGVRDAVFGYMPDVVALELCEKRFSTICSGGFGFHGSKGGWFRALLEGVREGSFLVFLGEGLARIQEELGRRYGLPPGSDMLAAINFAKEVGAEIALIDRDIEVTVSRLVNVPLREILGAARLGKDEAPVFCGLFGDGLGGILEEEKIVGVIDVIKKRLPHTHAVLIDERDRYMALSLHTIQKKNPGKRILAIVGAGHRRGILNYLNVLEKGREVKVGGLVQKRPISRLRVFLLSFMVLFVYILIKVELWRER